MTTCIVGIFGGNPFFEESSPVLNVTIPGRHGRALVRALAAQRAPPAWPGVAAGGADLAVCQGGYTSEGVSIKH